MTHEGTRRVRLELTNRSTAHIVKNLYPVYLHDLESYSDDPGLLPNDHGVVGEVAGVRDASSGTSQDTWWDEPTSCFPYLFRVGDAPAGFALVATHPYAKAGAQWEVYEFFVLRAYRREGVGLGAVRLIVANHPGHWRLGVLPRNEPALGFWRGILPQVARGGVNEEAVANDEGRGVAGVVFRFDAR